MSRAVAKNLIIIIIIIITEFLSIAPYVHNFKGADGRSVQCSVKAR